MNRTDAPKKQAVPFAVNGQREELLPTSPAGDNTASYDAGFPAVTMILKAAGGLPPKGQDMNQILFELSSLARWFSTGSINSYDATFSAEIGGYPKGAIVLGEDGNTRYMSTAEANTSDPNTDGAGWFNLSAGYLKTENNLSEIKGAGPDAVATALSNLGLGNLKYGAPMIGELVHWPRLEMPQEIWTDCGMEFIPYMGQSFDPVKYPLLAALHPGNKLPADMRGYAPRGWDNGRGIDINRELMSGQDDAIRNIQGQFGGYSVSGTSITAGAFTSDNATKSGPKDIDNISEGQNKTTFDASLVVPTANENRMKNVAWNMIVRAK